MNAGKYDSLSEFCLLVAEGRMAVVMVVEGRQGNGFSVSCRAEDRELERKLPGLLRLMADKLDALNRSGLDQQDPGNQ